MGMDLVYLAFLLPFQWMGFTTYSRLHRLTDAAVGYFDKVGMETHVIQSPFKESNQYADDEHLEDRNHLKHSIGAVTIFAQTSNISLQVVYVGSEFFQTGLDIR